MPKRIGVNDVKEVVAGEDNLAIIDTKDDLYLVGTKVNMKLMSGVR